MTPPQQPPTQPPEQPPTAWSDDDQRAFFATLDTHSFDHWWHRNRRELVFDLVHRTLGRTPTRIVDVGCGVGTLVHDATDRFPAAHAVGLDPSLDAVRRSASRAGARGPTARFVAAAAEALPVRTGWADVVTALDVVEHLDDDVAGLRQMLDATEAGGLVVVTVPAYTWLWSRHDEILGHRRRYRRRPIVAAAKAAGLEVVTSSYYLSWLVPVAALARRTPLRRLVRDTGEEASFVHPAVNRLLLAVCRLERSLMRVVPIPFGLSIVVVARRPVP